MIAAYNYISKPLVSVLRQESGIIKTNYDFRDEFVDKDLKIRGSGALWTIADGQQLGSVFTIDQGVAATLSGMTIKNWKGSFGGGIQNYSTTEVINCVIRDNYVDYHGGGIGNEGTLTVKNSKIIDNIAGGWGGGMCNHGTATIINSKVSGTL